MSTDRNGFSLRPKKATPTSDKHDNKGWWYEDRGGITVYSESTCTCGRIRVVGVRIAWHALASYVRRKMGRVVL